MSSQNNYIGKTIYMGIDVHKNSYSVASICNGELAKKSRITATPEELLMYIKKNFAGAEIYTAYEAGFSGFHLHRYLIENSINNIVAHPAAIEIAARERVKNDKRDSLKIATQLSVKRIKGIHIPNQEREANRTVTRLRVTLSKNRSRLAAQIKSLLFQHGLIKPYENSNVSKTWLKKLSREINKPIYPQGLQYTVSTYSEEWLAVNNRIKQIDKELVVQAQADKELDRIYRSVPGIGALSARILANELGDMRQFSNEKKLFSFSGLTPGEYSSGDKRYLGSISRQGKSIIRKVLVECAWIAIRKDPSLGSNYARIAKTRGAKRAIVAVGRQLLSRIRSCIIHNKIYKIKETKV